MNTTAGNSEAWSRRRWIYTIASVALLQLITVALLVRPVPPGPPRPTFATHVKYLGDPGNDSPSPSRFPVADPAQFALPSLEGFSSSAWLRYPPLSHPATEHSEPPQWLKLRPSALGEQFFQYLASNILVAPLLVDEPLPPVLRYESSFPPDTAPVLSRLRIEGDLARRELLTPFELPSMPHSDLISNTVIRAAVDASGFTFSSVFIGRSGLAAADELAARLVDQARFRPLPHRGTDRDSNLTWGTLIFLWQTAPLPPTNAALAPAPP